MFDSLDGKRVLCIVPHQDDEVIGLGGVLALACCRARSVDLVLVTDGAADGGVRCVLGETPCTPFAGLPEPPSRTVAAHEASLVRDAAQAWRHRWAEPPPFAVVPDPDRAPGFECRAWGQRRDEDFRFVARALGVAPDRLHFAFHDPECPLRIKDGLVAEDGARLSPEAMAERYARVATHYIGRFRPDLVVTMAPYEFMPAPNDHWGLATGVERAARGRVESVIYGHSGLLYQRIHEEGAAGLAEAVRAFALPPAIWAIKRRALGEYLVWAPEEGRYATAAHSVPRTFAALLSGGGAVEYFSEGPEILSSPAPARRPPSD